MRDALRDGPKLLERSTLFAFTSSRLTSFSTHPMFAMWLMLLLPSRKAGSQADGLSLQGFVAALCKTALEVFGGQEWHAGFPSPTDKLRLLFFLIDPSMAFFKSNRGILQRGRNVARAALASTGKRLSSLGLPSTYVAPPGLPETWRESRALVDQLYSPSPAGSAADGMRRSRQHSASVKSVSFKPAADEALPGAPGNVSVAELEGMFPANSTSPSAPSPFGIPRVTLSVQELERSFASPGKFSTSSGGSLRDQQQQQQQQQQQLSQAFATALASPLPASRPSSPSRRSAASSPNPSPSVEMTHQQFLFPEDEVVEGGGASLPMLHPPPPPPLPPPPPPLQQPPPLQTRVQPLPRLDLPWQQC